MKTRKPTSPRRPASPDVPGVLCGTDFTENARSALAVAALFARRWQTPLTVAHAAPGVEREAARAALSAEVARLESAPEAGLHQKVLGGEPDEALVELATPASTRLIVLASLGRRAAPRWFLGSVSARTAEHAAVPTLVVRRPEPLLNWLRGQTPLRIFVAFNFTSTSEAAVRWAASLRTLGPCELTVAYVDFPAESHARFAGVGPVPLVGNNPEVMALLLRDLRAKVTEILGSTEFKARVESNWGRPDARLADLADEEGAELVVVGSHQYQGFERLWQSSVSRGLLHRAGVSVAVIPTRSEHRQTVGGIPWVWRVLACTDFSDLGNHALPHAYAALPQGGAIKLVHVVDPYALPEGEYVQGFKTPRTEAQHRKLIEAAAARLRELVPSEADERGITTEVEVIEHPSPAKAICREAERFGADLLCLGTHGRSGLSKTVLGSVAQEVLAASRRPVQLVRSPEA
jgi:nucleotide-binding universal stress UspA family protein